MFSTGHEVKLNASTLAGRYYGPAHTDSDISVRFVEADILNASDTFWKGIYPFIDYSTGGQIDGTIAATEANIAYTTDQTIIIPGHGSPVGTCAQRRELRDMLADIRTNVALLKKRGLSLDPIRPQVANIDTPLHEHCLFELGAHLGELWHFGELATWFCAHRRSAFLLTAPHFVCPVAWDRPSPQSPPCKDAEITI